MDFHCFITSYTPAAALLLQPLWAMMLTWF
jgi:hypothetical protein